MLIKIRIFFILSLINIHLFNTLYGAKISVNNHLLIWYGGHSKINNNAHLIFYQCINKTNHSHSIEVNLQSVYSVSIGKLQDESQLYFTITGIHKFAPYISKISVNCENYQSKIETKFFAELIYDHMISIGFSGSIDHYGRLAIVCTSNEILYYDLINLESWYINTTWSTSTSFLPTNIDISNRFIYIVGYSFEEVNITSQQRYGQVLFYLIEIPLKNFQYKNEFDFIWMSNKSQYNSAVSFYPSISINFDTDGREILIGNGEKNTIYYLLIDYLRRPICLQQISSKTMLISSNEGYGTDFAWLNQGQGILVLYRYFTTNVGYQQSLLYYYEMKDKKSITNDTKELAIFPNDLQDYHDDFGRLLESITINPFRSTTLYLHSILNKILIIPPSIPGYYSVSYQSIKPLKASEPVFYFIANSVQCPPGTYKNDFGILPCHTCHPDEHNQFNQTLIFNCPQCTNQTACPLEIPIQFDSFIDIQQIGIYPESPENDIFDDIIILNLFKIDFTWKSSFLILIIIFSIVLVIIVFLLFCRFSKRQFLLKIFEHVDLITEGQFWFGGLITIVILVLAIFAATFSYSFQNRYPFEKHVWNNTDYNAKFDSSLQLLSSADQQYEEIFHLLNTQQFTLNIQLINTLIHCGRVTVKYEESDQFLPFSCYTNNRSLLLSIQLERHDLTLKLILSTNQTIESLCVGLNGSNHYIVDNYLHELNFLKRFQRNNYRMSQNPIINLQMTKSINLTESLIQTDNTTYTGLWLPTFNYDQEQLFTQWNISNFGKQTVLSIRISESAFFIKNKQKPIARRFEIIFHTILFIGVCKDLISFMLLILRLWFIPLILFSIRKLFPNNHFMSRFVEKKKDDLHLINTQQIQMIKDKQSTKF